MTRSLEVNYVPSPTMLRFHQSMALIRILLGPLGSGKSAAACMEIFRLATKMPPCKDGIRHSRACFIRDSDANLRKTTVRTWLKWFPEDVSKNGLSGLTKVNWSSPMSMRLNFKLTDNTWVDCEILCVYQACEQDAENLKSLELTWIYFNELNNIPEASLTMGRSRIKRYPSMDDLMPNPDGSIPKVRWGIIADSNMVPDDHWIYEKAEVSKPKGWEFFRQPPALFCRTDAAGKKWYTPNRGQKLAQGIPPAENIEHLHDGWKYYLDQVPGNSDEFIKVNLMAEYGTVKCGKPVFPDYSDMIHYRDVEIPFDRSKVLFISFDWGCTPTCSFGQLSDTGQARAIDEVCGKDMCIEVLWDSILRAKLVNEYGWGRGTKIFATGDPWGGRQSNQVTGMTCIQYLKSQGLEVIPSRVKSPVELRSAVDYFIHRNAGNNEPGMMLSNKVKMLRKGFCGWYFYKRIEAHKDSVYQDEPSKNSYSHVMDAWQQNCHAMRFPDLYDISTRVTIYDQYGNGLDCDGKPVPKKPSINMAGLI